MTRDTDRSTALDDAIDEVARAMAPRVVPDLRARIAEGSAARHASFPWWQPALVSAIVLVALVALWPGPEPTRVSEAPPVVEAPVTRSAELPRVQRPAPANTQRSARAAAPRRGRGPQAQDVAWEPTTVIPPIDVEPLLVERVEAATPTDTSLPEIPQLVVEPLHVEPLPRSEP